MKIREVTINDLAAVTNLEAICFPAAEAASVFSILRTKRLGLKRNTSPLLEVESGSNDPCSYMLTAIFLSLMKGDITGGGVVWMII
ncbi:MAG: hypothetical protein PUC92_03060 [bacterium]|nr:hypothetical protein [bacterium]